MAKLKSRFARSKPLLGRRSVQVSHDRNTSDLTLTFQRPIRQEDFRGGQVQTTSVAYRHKQSLFQKLRITPETAYALWLLLDKHFHEADEPHSLNSKSE